jgi:hypothetical protein
VQRLWPKLLWLVATMVVASGCTSPRQPAEAPPDETAGVAFAEPRAHNFLGVVAEAHLHDDWRVEPADALWSTGEDASTRVGPATVRLVDGDVLYIPAGTPGGNACPDLIRVEEIARMEAIPVEMADYDAVSHPKPSLCVLIGERDPEGVVSWFQVLHRLSDDGSQVEFGSGVLDNGRQVRVQEGFIFALAPDVRIDCLPGDGLDSPEEVFEERAGWHVSHVSVDTGQVTELACIYSD